MQLHLSSFERPPIPSPPLSFSNVSAHFKSLRMSSEDSIEISHCKQLFCPWFFDRDFSRFILLGHESNFSLSQWCLVFHSGYAIDPNLELNADDSLWRDLGSVFNSQQVSWDWNFWAEIRCRQYLIRPVSILYMVSSVCIPKSRVSELSSGWSSFSSSKFTSTMQLLTVSLSTHPAIQHPIWPLYLGHPPGPRGLSCCAALSSKIDKKASLLLWETVVKSPQQWSQQRPHTTCQWEQGLIL